MIGSAQKLLMARAGVPSGPPPDWDFSGFTDTGNTFSTSGQQGLPNDLYFKGDGTTFILCGLSGDTAYQYNLSTAWDISTASYASKSFYHGATAGAAQGLFVKPDGTSFYLLDFNSSNAPVYQYAMSTAWDLSTASYSSKSFSTGLGSKRGVEFSQDGVYMYISGANTVIDRFSLSTPWDVTTAGSKQSVNVSGSLSAAYVVDHVRVSPNGSSIAIYSSAGDDELNLGYMSTPWDVSSASLTSSHNIGSGVTGLFVSPNGANIYAHGFNPIRQYSTA
jgi:hypothetical protein